MTIFDVSKMDFIDLAAVLSFLLRLGLIGDVMMSQEAR